MAHEKNWRVSLCVQELHRPRDFQWILAAISSMSEHNGSPRSKSWSSFLFGFGFWVGVGNNASHPFFPFNMWTWHRHWMGIYSTLILSFSNLTVSWCCRSWWRRRAWGRCRMMTLPSWRCHWGWRMRTGGRARWQAWNHDRNEVLRVALYPNTVLMRCGFWPVIHP